MNEDYENNPQSLGAFEILRILGEGASATVYLAKEISLNRLVAIKVLKKELESDEIFKRRFIKEMDALAKLSHPNLVKIFASGTYNGSLYAAVEYVEGITIGDLIKKRPGYIPMRRALEIVKQVASGLDCIHTGGFIHRDIKPHNLMITKFGDVKIADFGLVKNLTPDDPNETGLTLESLGTPKYISPEQAVNAKSVDHRTDIYSLGVTTYELLTGRTPFQGNMVEQLYARRDGTFDLPSAINPKLPEQIDYLVFRMMAKVPNDRFSSAREIVSTIDEILARLHEFKNNKKRLDDLISKIDFDDLL